MLEKNNEYSIGKTAEPHSKNAAIILAIILIHLSTHTTPIGINEYRAIYYEIITYLSVSATQGRCKNHECAQQGQQ